MDAPEEALPLSLKLLKGLVLVLTGVMIVGVLVIIFLLVTRLQASDLPLPENIVLPEGEEVEAITVGQGFYVVVTKPGNIVVYDRLTGQVKQTVTVEK